MTPRYPRLCAAALLVLCTMLPFAVIVEAKGKKGKSSASRSRGKSSHRSAARHSRNRRPASRLTAAESDYAIVPDEIEVLEHGSSRSTDLARWLNPPVPRAAIPANYSEPDLTSPAKHRSVNIESARVIQIQQALASRGYYSGEMTGLYDEATVDGMRRFQAASKIGVTGYPTAQSLKRLGLTNW